MRIILEIVTCKYVIIIESILKKKRHFTLPVLKFSLIPMIRILSFFNPLVFNIKM